MPEKVLSNHDLEKMVDTSDQWIIERTGIKKRHIAAENETTCDLAEHAARDAGRIEVEVVRPRESPGCRCGEVLKGVIEPPECPLYERVCVPDDPRGACMVSSEGTCAAWYRHERYAMGARA